MQAAALCTNGRLGLATVVLLTLNEVIFFFNQVLFFLISMLNVDFTLVTKVQVNGKVLIVGLDSQGREIFKLYMNDSGNTAGIPSRETLIG